MINGSQELPTMWPISLVGWDAKEKKSPNVVGDFFQLLSILREGFGKVFATFCIQNQPDVDCLLQIYCIYFETLAQII